MVTIRDLGSVFLSAGRCILLFPTMFVAITIYAIWPWRSRPPAGLLRPLNLPEETRIASSLRFLMLRLRLRTDWVSRAPHGVRIRTLGGWLLRPFFETIPRCWRLAGDEVKRSGGSFLDRLVLFLDALPDSLRYANGLGGRFWFDPDRRPAAGFHIPNDYHVRVGGYLMNHANNPSMPLHQRHFDKTELYLVCKANGWPTVPVYASFVDGETIRHEPVPENTPLISKPSGLTEGRGHFERWIPQDGQASGNPVYRGDDGRRLTRSEIEDHLTELSRETPYLLQELLACHEEIEALSGVETLCTLRLPTCCFPDGGAEILPLSLFRMPRRRDVLFDNMSQGAVAYKVDTETGRLLPGAIYGSAERFSVHPTTQREAVGFRLPYFDDSVRLVLEAHSSAFPTFPTVGWDIAITDSGPVIVEMNIQWGAEHDIPDEGFLGQTPYADCMLAHMRRLWPHAVRETRNPTTV